MNVGTGTVAAQFLSWEYLFRTFGIVSLQCGSLTLVSRTYGGGNMTGEPMWDCSYVWPRVVGGGGAGRENSS
jgi:hypothetical protein